MLKRISNPDQLYNIRPFFPPIPPTPIPQQVSSGKVKISSREGREMSIANRLNSIFSYLNSMDSLHTTYFCLL